MRAEGRAPRTAVYAALAIGLYTVEAVIPTPLPWLRVGVANVAVVLALYDLGPGGAGAVLALKLVVGSLLLGRFLTPFFWFAAAGGAVALGMMVLSRAVAGRWLTIVGVSVVGGVAHNLAQLAVARLLLVPSDAVWLLAPVLVVVGAASGAAIGLLARLVRLRLAGAA